MQPRQDDWNWQWRHLSDESLFLFKEWIAPRTLEDFRGKTVADAGCGGGQHTAFVAPYASKVYAIDLNTVAIARERNRASQNVAFVEGDIARVRLPEPVDILFCIGVIHHTDDPTATFAHLRTLVKPGGLMIVWCYSKEGNFLNERVLEPLKRAILLKLPKSILLGLAHLLTILITPIVWSVYLLPVPFLPYYQYFQNWRKLGYRRNMLNVFDKLNAPQTHFIDRATVGRWFSPDRFDDIVIRPYMGVSWHGSGRAKRD